VTRRAPKVGESSQARAKTILRTSSADEFNYLPPAFLEENQRAFEILFSKWKIDLSVLNLRLPDRRPMPSRTIIMEPEHGVHFENGQGELRYQGAKDTSPIC